MSEQQAETRLDKSSLRDAGVAFLVAVQFLSVGPAFIKRSLTPWELGRATAFFPLVGLLFGIILFGASALFSLVFPASVVAGLLLAIWVLLSGALHLDGFLDSCDGLFGGRTPEARLDIMRDERVGAFGLAGGVLLLLLKFAALSALPAASPALALAPTLGRWSMAAAIFAFPYARKRGLGRAMKDHTGGWQLTIASAIAVAASWLAAGPTGLLVALLAGPFAWLSARLALQRIPGMTGDTYGALNELVELFVLLAFVAL